MAQQGPAPLCRSPCWPSVDVSVLKGSEVQQGGQLGLPGLWERSLAQRRPPGWCEGTWNMGFCDGEATPAASGWRARWPGLGGTVNSSQEELGSH